MPTYRQWRFLITMSWVMWPVLNHYLKLKNTLSKRWETELDSSSGQDNKQRTEDGTDLIPRYLLKKEHSTLIKYTSGHNTITILTTSIRPPSKNTNSNTMIQSG